MLSPDIAARMKQSDLALRHLVKARQVIRLVDVAGATGQREIIFLVRACFGLWLDVLDL
jgi:hypothetical protein